MDLIPRNFNFDSVFDNFLLDKSYSNMKCDVYEKNGLYHIEMDIPGFSKEDITIELNNNYLVITAVKNNEVNSQDEEKRYIHQERSYGKYQRSFYVGNVDTNSIEAEFKNGMLKVVIPKNTTEDTNKIIQIK